MASEQQVDMAAATCDRGQARENLEAFINGYREAFLLTGPAGVGKTSLLAEMLAGLGSDVPLVMLDGETLPEDGLVSEVCRQLGVENESDDWDIILGALSNRLQGHDHAFLVIDNAHALPASALEELHLLSYLRCGRGPELQFVLAGRHSLLQAVADSPLQRLRLLNFQRCALIDAERKLYVVENQEGASPPADSPQAGEVSLAEKVRALKQSQPQPEGDSSTQSASNGKSDKKQKSARSSAGDEAAVAVGAVTGASLDSEGTSSGPTRRVAWLALPVALLLAWWLAREPVGEPAEADLSGEGDIEVMAGNTPGAVQEALANTVPKTVTADDPVAVEAPESIDTAQETGSAVDELADTGSGDVATTAPVAVVSAVEDPATAAILQQPVDATGVEVGEPALVLPVQQNEMPVNPVEAQLNAAAEALRKDFLSTPREQSAWQYYNAVLSLDPGNAEALDGIQQIANRYVALTHLAIDRGRYSSAQTYIDRGLTVVPGHPGLSMLQGELDTAVQRRAQAERARELQQASAPAALVEEPVPAEESAEEPAGVIGFLRRVFSGDNAGSQEEP